jgi:DNA-binding HxlR family transcriptional regulator
MPRNVSKKEIEQAIELMEFLSYKNRLWVFMSVHGGASRGEMVRELAQGPDSVMVPRTVKRQLNQLEDEGLIEEVGDREYELTPPVEKLTTDPEGLIKRLASMYVGSQAMRRYIIREWAEEFVDKFRDASLTEGDVEACEAYRERVIGTVYGEDRLLPEEERVSEIKEITNGVVSPGDRMTGYSTYHRPISEGLPCTFIHSKSLVDKLENKPRWRKEAYEHQRAGLEEGENPPIAERQVSYYAIDEMIPYTLTIFGSESVGIFIDGTNKESIFIESEHSEAIEWAQKKFNSKMTNAASKRYRPSE